VRLAKLSPAAALTLSLWLGAQAGCGRPASEPPAPADGAAAVAPSSTHGQAARELYELVGGARDPEVGAQAILPVIQANPALAPYEDVFREWYRRVLEESSLHEQIVALYAEAFSEQELRELGAFYRSPLGEKAIARLPELVKRGAEIGARAAEAHMGELQQMLADRQAEDQREAREESHGEEVPRAPGASADEEPAKEP
jgi:uncharacterized protein